MKDYQWGLLLRWIFHFPQLILEDDSIDDNLIGGNKSAEEPEDSGTEEKQTQKVVNLVKGSNLEEDETLKVPPKKGDVEKAIQTYVKKLVTKIKETRPDYVPTFKANVSKAMRRILSIGNWKFYRGEDDGFECEGMLAFLGFREDGETPYMLFFKDGLYKEEAVRFAGVSYFLFIYRGVYLEF